MDNYSVRPGGKVSKAVTREAILNLFHPFQTFILGQKNLAPKIAKKYGIELVFYGESETEYGNPIADNSSSLRDKSYHTMQNIDEMYLAGLPVKEIIEERAKNYKEPQQVIYYFYSDEEQLKNIESISLEEQVVDLLTSSAKSQEEELTYEECISGNYQG